MFAWMYWCLCNCIYYMVVLVERVFWLLVDDYLFSWLKDLIHQLLENTVPPSSPPTPEPITVTNISPTNSTIDRNVTGDSNNMSTVFDPNPEIQAIEVDLPLVAQPRPSIVVIGSQFCSNSKIELTITGKTGKSIFDNFCVKDGNGKIIFMVEEGESILHVRRILVNAAGRSILSMEKKIKSTHKRWRVFKGDSRYNEDLLFVAKQTSVVQIRTKLKVFLASNANEAICNFLVRGRWPWSEQSCQIHGAGRSGILAQMRKDLTPSAGNDTYTLTVYPNIDCAFIVTLIFILDTINNVLRLED